VGCATTPSQGAVSAGVSLPTPGAAAGVLATTSGGGAARERV